MPPTKTLAVLILRGRLHPRRGRVVRAALREEPEVLEPRCLLNAAPIEFGGVYVEQDLGSDAHPDSIEISFVGGAPGTRLTRVEIDGDKFSPGLSLADVLFDTRIGGLGADLAFAGRVASQIGDFTTQVIVEDGSSTLTLVLDEFQAGDKLTLAVDVDEVQGFSDGETDVTVINEELDPITSGAEFQGSWITVFFEAPHFYEASGRAEFRNRYDDQFIGDELDLPRDDQAGNRDRTAGAISGLQQKPLPIEISGKVFEDLRADLVLADEDSGIAGVELALFAKQGDEYQYTGHSALTDASGDYRFDASLDLSPGVYQVRESQPIGYFSVGAVVGQVGQYASGQVMAGNPDVLTEIDVSLGGLRATNYNFAEARHAALSGQVHLSTPEGDCFGAGVQRQPVVGAVVLLQNAEGETIAETTTDAEGNYAFRNLRPGEYAIIEITPTGLIEGGVSVGRVEGATRGQAQVDRIASIELFSGEEGRDYEFCDHLPARLSGHVFHDRDNSGERDAGEEGLAAALLSLLDEQDAIVQTVVTDEQGRYEFTGLPAGEYRIVESQPAGWLDGLDRAGKVNQRVVGRAVNPGDAIDSIALLWGDNGADYDFGELLPASLQGRVHLSTPEGDCFGIAEELLQPVAGALVQLLDADGQVLAEAVTSSDGVYVFPDLTPGEYGVRELTPTTLVDGGARAGRVAGEARGQVTSSGEIQDIRLNSAEQGREFDFCEHQPAVLSGFVYADANNDASRQSFESPIPDVTVQLLTGGRLVAETSTDAAGQYRFENLPPGEYTVREIHPRGWLDGQDSPGTVNGAARGEALNPGDEIQHIFLHWSDVGRDFNFAELQPASLSGRVHSSRLEDCWNDPAAEPLAGVNILLIDDRGRTVAETTTDAAGRYRFVDVAPGRFSVQEIQPAGVFQGSQRAGSGGGEVDVDDLISNVLVDPGAELTGYDFCELPPSTLSGFVFQDGEAILLAPEETPPEDLSAVRDGVLTADDTRLAGVVLELRRGITGEPVLADEALAGVYPQGPIQTVTDEDGYYEFTGLPKGNYAVYELQPEGYLDGIDTPGTTDGIAINPRVADEGDIFLETVVSMLVEPPRNDAIVRIGLPPGVVSMQNNFSEVTARTVQPPKFPALIEPPPPRPIAAPKVVRQIPPPIPLPPRIAPPAPAEVPYDANSGSSFRAYTWHLSVLDGGQPRAWQPGEATSLLFSAATWRQQPMCEGCWQIDVTQTAHGRGSQTAFFGVAGGTPIAGDFNGDGITEMGLFQDGNWFIDLNANGRWDANDLWARLGYEGDLPVTGDWDGDGKDDIGIFGRAWPRDPRAVASEPGLPDMDNPIRDAAKNLPPREEHAPLGRRVLRLTAGGRLRADLIDHVFRFGTAGDHALAGDWNGDGIDTVGVFRAGNWKLDVDGDGRWSDADADLEFGRLGDVPLVGDFNGDGIDDLAVFRDGVLYIDSNGNRQLDHDDLAVAWHGSEDAIPVVGKWNGEAIDQVGWYLPGAERSMVVAGRPADSRQ